MSGYARPSASADTQRTELHVTLAKAGSAGGGGGGDGVSPEGQIGASAFVTRRSLRETTEVVDLAATTGAGVGGFLPEADPKKPTLVLLNLLLAPADSALRRYTMAE